MKLAERRDVAARALRQQRPGGRLVGVPDLANHGEAEAVRRRRIESQLRERNLELGVPPFGVAADRDVPHRIPAAVVVGVVEPVGIEFDAGGVDAELERGPAVVVRVDEHRDPIRRRRIIAPREQSDDLVRLRIVSPHRDIERRAIEEHPHLGGVRRFGAFGRLALTKICDGDDVAPALFGQLAVNLDGFGCHRERHRINGRHTGAARRRRHVVVLSRGQAGCGDPRCGERGDEDHPRPARAGAGSHGGLDGTPGQ